MMMATFNGNPNATIIFCYNPTNVREEKNLIGFYNELSSLDCSILKHIFPVISGNMNAKTGKKSKPQIQLTIQTETVNILQIPR